MKEQIISLKTAELAKQLNFNIRTYQFYDNNDNLSIGIEYAYSNWNNGIGHHPILAEEVKCSAPTQSLLQKWLREKYNIHIDIISYSLEKIYFYYEIKRYVDEKLQPICDYNESCTTYEKCLENALYDALCKIQ